MDETQGFLVDLRFQSHPKTKSLLRIFPRTLLTLGWRLELCIPKTQATSGGHRSSCQEAILWLQEGK